MESYKIYELQEIERIKHYIKTEENLNWVEMLELFNEVLLEKTIKELLLNGSINET